MLSIYYFQHRRDAIVWGDVGAQWGHYDPDGGLGPLEDGYGDPYPTFEEATLFGSFYSSSELPPPRPGPPEDPPLPPLTYSDIMTDANLCYASLLDTVDYPVTTTYTGVFVGTNTSTGTPRDIYEQELSALSAGNPPLPPGKYHFTSDAVLTGTLTLNGDSDDVWIFQIEGNLYARGSARVKLTGGAVAQNVWWQVGVEEPYGQYDHYDPVTGYYIYKFMPGAYIGDDLSYPPYNDPDVTGHASFQGNILCMGDTAIGQGSNLTGRLMSLDYGWWLYAAVVNGSVSINATQPLALETAFDFALLAYADITNTGETSVKGDVGVATGVSGPRPPSPDEIQVDPLDTWYLDGATECGAARISAAAAGLEASLRDLDYDLTGERLLGKRLPPGVYLIDDEAFTGDPSSAGPVTLDGLNDPASCWIFRMAGTGAMDLDVAAGVINFVYDNGANPDGVFWVCSTATLGASVALRGTILASGGDVPTPAISLGADAVLQGRAISAGGSIVLNNNTVFSDSTGGLLAWISPQVRQSNPVTTKEDEARSVANDTDNMYVFGFQGGQGSGNDNSWRIEKRLLSDGSLVTSFGTGGALVWNPGAGDEIPRRIICDGGALYLFGSSETALGSTIYQWRIEKRSVSDGALISAFDTDGFIVTSMLNGGVAGDMALESGDLYLVGGQSDVLTPATKRIRIEKRSAISGALVTGFKDPVANTWIVDGHPTTTDPSPAPPADPILPHYTPTEGVVIDLSESGFSRTAGCITIVPTPFPADTPALIVGGWQDYFGLKMSLMQKRYLSTGLLDAATGVGDIAFGSDASGTNFMPLWFSGDNIIHSIVSDDEFVYLLASVNYTPVGPPSVPPLIPGVQYWCLQKRRVDTAAEVTTTYLYGIYGPVPYAETLGDFASTHLAIDTAVHRLYVVGSNTGPYGGEMWRIEKRKTSTLVLDALFNTEGARPGVVESDPDPGQPALPEMWYVYVGDPEYTYKWTTTDPGAGGYIDHIAGSPLVPGRPDRAWAVTMNSAQLFIVGMDSTDVPPADPAPPAPPNKRGRWRIEARNR